MVRHIRKDELDRFYTLPAVAEWCLQKVNLSGFPLVVEPSAGSGSFSDLLLGCEALDIRPARSGVVQADFLSWSPPSHRPAAVVGNPPYGVNGSLVVAFIKKACSFADLVAFILPLSYQKVSMHARWPKSFHLVGDYALPTPNATLDGAPTATRNCFQVWERRDYPRVDEPPPTPIGWHKTTRDKAQFAMRTHGAGLGQLSNPTTANASSHLFFTVGKVVDADRLGRVLERHQWPDLNMGQPSIGARDYVPVINRALRIK